MNRLYDNIGSLYNLGINVMNYFDFTGIEFSILAKNRHYCLVILHMVKQSLYILVLRYNYNACAVINCVSCKLTHVDIHRKE